METLFSAEEVAARIAEMGKEIGELYKEEPLTLIAIANGGCFFGCDLARAIPVPHWFDVIALGSYRNNRKCGVPELRCAPKLDPSGRHILIADDVLDSGDTLEFCRGYFRGKGALSVRCAVLTSKAVRHNSSAEWIGFPAPDRYLVGCGMDDCECDRNLRFIAAKN